MFFFRVRAFKQRSNQYERNSARNRCYFCIQIRCKLVCQAEIQEIDWFLVCLFIRGAKMNCAVEYFKSPIFMFFLGDIFLKWSKKAYECWHWFLFNVAAFRTTTLFIPFKDTCRNQSQRRQHIDHWVFCLYNYLRKKLRKQKENSAYDHQQIIWSKLCKCLSNGLIHLKWQKSQFIGNAFGCTIAFFVCVWLKIILALVKLILSLKMEANDLFFKFIWGSIV